MNYKSTAGKTKHTTTLLNSTEQYKNDSASRVGADEKIHNRTRPSFIEPYRIPLCLFIGAHAPLPNLQVHYQNGLYKAKSNSMALRECR